AVERDARSALVGGTNVPPFEEATIARPADDAADARRRPAAGAALAGARGGDAASVEVACDLPLALAVGIAARQLQHHLRLRGVDGELSAALAVGVDGSDVVVAVDLAADVQAGFGLSLQRLAGALRCLRTLVLRHSRLDGGDDALLGGVQLHLLAVGV